MASWISDVFLDLPRNSHAFSAWFWKLPWKNPVSTVCFLQKDKFWVQPPSQSPECVPGAIAAKAKAAHRKNFHVINKVWFNSLIKFRIGGKFWSRLLDWDWLDWIGLIVDWDLDYWMDWLRLDSSAINVRKGTSQTRNAWLYHVFIWCDKN